VIEDKIRRDQKGQPRPTLDRFYSIALVAEKWQGALLGAMNKAEGPWLRDRKGEHSGTLYVTLFYMDAHAGSEKLRYGKFIYSWKR
jgi:hypothetical protein